MFEKCQNVQKADLFRRFALIFLAIHKVWLRQIALADKKSLAVGHSAIFQTSPNADFGEVPAKPLLTHRDKGYISAWIRSGENDRGIARQLSYAYVSHTEW